MEMNIFFSSDDNYARHLGVAMYSLMIHNQNVEKINFFVVDNHISEENRSRLEEIVRNYKNSKLSFINYDLYAQKLQLDMPWPISISAYARLFLAEMLPLEVNRVLYLDCDMVVNHDLSELWNFNLHGHCVGAVQDQVNPKIKESVGLLSTDQYFNSGLLLVDLIRWRELKIGNQALSFICRHQGKVIHHDQGVLNGLLYNDWIRLPLKYNVMTIHYIMDQARVIRYFSDYSGFYSLQEIEEAKASPCILHYTPSFTSRPWEQNCRHPYGYIYQHILSNTSWKSVAKEKERISWIAKIINWRYRNLPF